MPKVSSSLKCISFDYDFAINGGAISTIQTGAWVPGGAFITQFWVRPVTNLASGGAATVNLGFTGKAAGLFTNTNGTLQDYRDYNSGTWGIVANGVPEYLAITASAIPVATPVQMLVTIAAFVLTAGKFNVGVVYIEN